MTPVSKDRYSNHPTEPFDGHGLTAYLWATPNSRRLAILLEELALPYVVVPVNIRAREQFRPDILALNPFGKVPILTWLERGEKHVLFESGAMLLTLAERCGALLPEARAERESTLIWLMVALTGLAPAIGQAHHWLALASDRLPAAIAHSQAGVRRVLELLDARCAGRHYLAGAYSIADVAAYPWVERHPWAGVALTDYPNLRNWFERVGERAAVRRGMAQPHGIVME